MRSVECNSMEFIFHVVRNKAFSFVIRVKRDSVNTLPCDSIYLRTHPDAALVELVESDVLKSSHQDSGVVVHVDTVNFICTGDCRDFK